MAELLGDDGWAEIRKPLTSSRCNAPCRASHSPRSSSASHGRELAGWHWHPGGSSPWRQPHLHVAGGRFGECHLPTGRVSLEEVLRLLLAELDVRPLRDDWPAVLDEVEAAFREWRTWS